MNATDPTHAPVEAVVDAAAQAPLSRKSHGQPAVNDLGMIRRFTPGTRIGVGRGKGSLTSCRAPEGPGSFR